MLSIATSKIFQATTALLALALSYTLISKNRAIDALQTTVDVQGSTIAQLRVKAATLKFNNVLVEQGLTQCNMSVDAAAEAADRVAKAGVSAVRQVQQAGSGNRARVLRVEAMPAQTCADAEAILRSPE